KSDVPVSNISKAGLIYRRNIDTFEEVLSLRRTVEATDDVHHRRFPRAGRSHYCDEFTTTDFERYATECVNFNIAHMVDLMNALEANDRIANLNRCLLAYWFYTAVHDLNCLGVRRHRRPALRIQERMVAQ